MNEAFARLQGFTHFERPVWLWVGVVVALLLPVLYHLQDRRQRRLLAAFSLPHDGDAWGAEVSPVLLWLRRACLAGAVLGVCAALAQPLGAPEVLTEPGRGIDLLFAIDTSRSMLTQDVKPDRLTRARLAVEDLLDRLNGDAVGLVAFAGEAFLQAPLTTDYDAFRETLGALDTRTIAVGGTNLAAAIATAQQALASREDATAVLVLITDGEDLDGEALAAAQAAGKAGIRIYTVGVGTAAGDLIPLPGGAAGGDRFVRDSEGRFVRSSLDEAMLRQIAAATGGSYQPLGERGQGVADLYQHTLSTLARHVTAGRVVMQYAQLFQWPAGGAALLLCIEWLVRPVRLRGVVKPADAARTQTRALVPALAGLLLVPCAGRSSQAQAAQGPDGYAQGAQAYRNHDYAGAVRAYRQALQTGDVQRQQNAYYNLGNALYRAGGTLQGGDPQQAAENWRQSIAAYDTALQLWPDDADAKFNRDVVRKQLDELQRQQQQKQQNQNQNSQRQDQGQQNPQGQPVQQAQQGHPDPQGRAGQGGDQQQNQHSQQGQDQGRNQQGQNPQPGQQNGDSRNDPQPGNPQNPQLAQQQRQTPQPGQQDSQVPAARPDSDVQPASHAGSVAQTQPDQMTREEAERLLDSVRGQERRMVSRSDGKPGRRALPLKDW